MQKWEHRITMLSYADSQLNTWIDLLGAEGWQLVTVVDNPTNYYRTYYFKRPIVEEVPGKMTEADKKKEIDEIIRRTNELTPAHKNKQNDKK